MINRKYILQKKPVYEYDDPRSSENSKHAENQRKQQRRLVSKLLGKNYFTNTQSVMEINEGNKK
jgi:hypothetical protein